MAKVKNTESRAVDENDLVGRAKKYAFLKAQLDFLEKEQKELRVKLFENLDMDGEEDDKGNIVLELQRKLKGTVLSLNNAEYLVKLTRQEQKNLLLKREWKIPCIKLCV